MGRHFTSTLTCISVLLASLLLSISVDAAQGEKPSFDCRKAASLSEKTICANAALSRLDFQLGRTWKTLLDDFIDSAQETLMKKDQRTWMARRTKCGEDADCIGKLYRDRLSTLNGVDPAHRFSGVYEVKDIGIFALYPIGNRYLVNIQTADPNDGRWVCELAGEAGSSGDDLEIKVAGTHKESDNVTSFVLAPIDGQPLPVCQAGQFVVLRLVVDPDPGKPPVLRSYSLSDLPAADHFRISVKNELNGIGSSFLCNRAREGDVLDVSAPRGSFTLRPGQSPVVLLSAGVGATPVMSMLHSLAAERSQREIWWIYGARNRVDHPFAEESRSLLKQLSRGRGYIVYSRPAATDQVGADFDAPGHIDTALLERIGVPQGSDFYLCGPPSFLQNMRDGLRNWGVLAGNVHTEIFGSLEAITPGMAQVVHTPHLPQGPPGSGPPVSFARSGITAAWDPKFGSLLELAEACDVPVRWSCRTGVCHTCMTGLIGGSIIYNPEPLERPAPGNVLVCCSQPNAGVTLDL